MVPGNISESSFGVTLIFNLKWTLFEEQTDQGAAAWAAVEPDEQRICIRVTPGFEEPVEHLTVGFGPDRDEPVLGFLWEKVTVGLRVR
mgnify:FL=1